MGIIKKIGVLFKKKDTVVKKREIPSESIVFNVDNFNKWFCDPNNKAKYSNAGIFLRIDKLSDSQIADYLVKCYGVPKYGPYLWSQPTWKMIDEFHKEIRKDWVSKLSKNNEPT